MVQYGGQHKSTDEFQKAECNVNIKSANKIGFWCDWSAGDGSVMMIGEGAVPVLIMGFYDAQTKKAPSQSYLLNLWIR